MTMHRACFAAVLIATLCSAPAVAMEFAVPDEVFRVSTAEWAQQSANGTGQIILTQGGGASPPTWGLVAGYAWAPMMKGAVGANGFKTHVDVSFSDILKLIPDLNGALMGHVEVGRGPGGVLIDALFLQIEPTFR